MAASGGGEVRRFRVSWTAGKQKWHFCCLETRRNGEETNVYRRKQGKRCDKTRRKPALIFGTTAAGGPTHIHPVLLSGGNQSEGRLPDVIFLNFLTTLPTTHYPVREGGARKETPSNQRFMLPAYIVYLVNTFYVMFSIFLMFHLLRRRPINHSSGEGYLDLNLAEEEQLEAMRSARRSERSRLFFYKRWTNHVATSYKLQSTFERDFNELAIGLSEEEYLRRNRLEVTRLKLEAPLFDDDDF